MPFSRKGFPLGRLRMSMAGLTDGATDPRREPSSCDRLGVLADTRPLVFLCPDFLAVIGAVAELAFQLSVITTVACSPTSRRSAGCRALHTLHMYVRDKCCKHKRLLCTCWVLLDDRTHWQRLRPGNLSRAWLAGWLPGGWLAG